MHLSEIQQKLSTYPIEDLSAHSKFNLRADAKVTFLNFLAGFFMSMQQGHSLRIWAKSISGFLPVGQVLSKAGLQKRFGSRQLDAVKCLLEMVMARQLRPLHHQSQQAGWFARFGQVFVEDSVCVSLNQSLSEVFRGGRNQTRRKSAVARIQVAIELKSLQYARFVLKGYRDNDQKWSSQILSLISAGDLVIRDMGYFVLSSFEKIMAKGAFFLTRYKRSTTLYEGKQGKRIDLLRRLEQAHRRGQTLIEMPVWVGDHHRLPLRLVASEVPSEVFEARVRKAKKDRNPHTNHNQTYFALLRWSIFLTNVPAHDWPAEKVSHIYGFRWQIEIIFKVWKSKFSLAQLMKRAQIKKALHAQLFFFLFWIYLLLFYAWYFQYFLERIYRQTGKILSMLLFADFFHQHFEKLIRKDNLNQLDSFLEELSQYYCHEKRKDRIPLLARIYQIALLQ